MDNDLEYLMNEIKADQKPVKPKRRRKRRRGGAFLILFLFVFIIVLVAGGLLFWWMQRPERKLPGQWHRTVDYTQEATLAAKEWLMEAEGGREIDLTEYMGKVQIGVDLVLSEDGSWSSTVDEASYAEAKQQAYEALEQGLVELSGERLKKSYLTSAQNSNQERQKEIIDMLETITPESIRETIENVTGMPCIEYLKTYGPELLPPLEEIQGQYNLNGSWKAENGVLLRDGKGEAFMINTDLLVLSGADGTEVYYRNAE